MLSHLLRQRLAPLRAVLNSGKPTLQSRPVSSLLRPRPHPFFNHSASLKMNGSINPLTRLHLQRTQRFYHSGYGSYGSSGSNSVMSAFYFLFGANALVFGAINYAKYNKDWRLEKKILGNSLLSPATWDSGRWYTVITSAFAHIDPFHFAFNMLSLFNFCSICSMVPWISGLHIYAIVFGSAISGGLGFVYHQKNRVREAGRNWQAATQTYNTSALGASGAVMGVGAVAACLVPNARMGFLFIPFSFPLWVFLTGYGVIDAYFLNSPTSTIAHAGHLGGLVFGSLYYLAFLRKAPIGVWSNFSRLLTSRKR